MAIHWGWYWKIKKQHIPKKLCSQFPRIDSFRLYKNNLPVELTVKPLNIKACIKLDHLSITYPSFTRKISIEKLLCNYGGFRYFFRCPLCNRRMRFLYLAENSVFLCRKCLNLGYRSQRLRPSQRCLYMETKIEQNIKRQGGNPTRKPIYMHKKTFSKLQNKLSTYEERFNYELNKELLKWHGKRIEPYL